MTDKLPLMIALGLALLWVACIFYGTESLYRKKSPLNIIYWGSWVCYFLWYKTWMKEHGYQEMQTLITVILTIAIIMGALFTIFGSERKAPNRGQMR